MQKELVDSLCSPDTRAPLDLEVFDTDPDDADDVVTGRLVDKQTSVWFRIEEGIPDLVPMSLRRHHLYDEFAKRNGLDYVPPASVSDGDEQSKEQIDFFSNHVEGYEEEVVDSTFYRVMDEVNFERWVGAQIKEGDLVAEIGCGTGRQSISLARGGARVVSVDLAEEMLRKARTKLKQRVPGARGNFVAGSAEALPLKNMACDAAVIYGSLHHFSNPPLAIRNAGTVLNERGKFYMLEPHKSPLRPLFDLSMHIWTLWEEEAHDEPLFTAAQFKSWLSEIGIHPTIHYTTYLPPHLFYLFNHKMGVWLLSKSDAVANALPGIRKLGGVIVAEGTKSGG